MQAAGGPVPEGQVYAQLICSGQGHPPFDDANLTGAGRIHMPHSGWGWFSYADITPGVSREIPIDLSSKDAVTLDAALWWDQTLVISNGHRQDTHDDVDLALVDPNGHVQASSKDGPGIFERAHAALHPPEGTWLVRIIPNQLHSQTVRVYFSAAALRAQNPTDSNGSPITPNP